MRIEKLKTLKSEVALKKIALTIALWEKDISKIDKDEFSELINFTITLDKNNASKILELSNIFLNGGPLYPLCEFLKQRTNLASQDWDFTTFSKLDASKRIIKKHYIILDSIRSPYNIGAIFRSCESFFIDTIILTDDCPLPTSPKALRTAAGCVEIINYKIMKREEIITKIKNGELGKIFACELGGTNINEFKFPNMGTMIVGSEEFGVGKDFLDICDDIVSIPLYGAKGSINVSVAAGIALQHWK